MALTDTDRQLVQRCLSHDPTAWRDFVDRFLGVIQHVVQHAAHMRSMMVQQDTVEDLAAEIMARIVADDFKVLRRFRGKSSLATYLTVIARRIAVNRLARMQAIQKMRAERRAEMSQPESSPELVLENREEVERLLGNLQGREAELVRSYYLEHKSYEEISHEMGIPENSVGPTLSRIRARLRDVASKG